jgi:hypothetical protein
MGQERQSQIGRGWKVLEGIDNFLNQQLMHVGTPDDATPQLQNLIHLRKFMPALWAQSICVKP